MGASVVQGLSLGDPPTEGTADLCGCLQAHSSSEGKPDRLLIGVPLPVLYWGRYIACVVSRASFHEMILGFSRS